MIELVETFLFVFALVDPIGTVPVYLEATKHFDPAARKRITINPDYAVDRANQTLALAESGLEHDRGESDPYSGSPLHCNREPSSGKG